MVAFRAWWSAKTAGAVRPQPQFRYVCEAGHLQRIDAEGHATPAVTRRYDSAGRLRERRFDSGTGAPTRETQRYRRDGTLERLQIKNGMLFAKSVDFDVDERPFAFRTPTSSIAMKPERPTRA